MIALITNIVKQLWIHHEHEHEHEDVEATLKWFLSMSCEGLSPDTTTFVAVSLECVYGIACKLVDCFRLLWSTHICFLSHCLTQDMLGKNILYVVDVMTFCFFSLMEGYFVLEFFFYGHTNKKTS